MEPKIFIIKKENKTKVIGQIPVIIDVSEEDNNFCEICLPFLGNLRTWADNNSLDIDLALQEAFKGFVLLCNTTSNLEKELECIGWELKHTKKDVFIFVFKDFSTRFSIPSLPYYTLRCQFQS
jgi:hypothetical protein